MGLDKQEDELLEKLEEKGLERKIRHIQFDEPRDIEYDGKEYRNTIGITAVMLVNEDEEIDECTLNSFMNIEYTKNTFEIGKIGNNLTGFKKSIDCPPSVTPLELESFGVAICSNEEPEYHKQLGRIIATGRAMKDSNLK